MRIRSAIGFGIFIIILKFLIPAVLNQGIATATSFLKGAEISANVASSYAAQTAALGHPSQPPFPLPQATQIALPSR